MNWSSIPASDSFPASAPEAAPRAVPTIGIKKSVPTTVPHRGAGQSASGCRIHQLIELDLSIRRLDDDNGVLELDEILLLQVKDLLAHLLGFLFSGEGNENQVAHLWPSLCAHRLPRAELGSSRRTHLDHHCPAARVRMAAMKSAAV